MSRHVAGGKRRSSPPASPPDVRGISRNFNYFLRGRGCPRGAEPVTPRARALAGVRHGGGTAPHPPRSGLASTGFRERGKAKPGGFGAAVRVAPAPVWGLHRPEGCFPP